MTTKKEKPSYEELEKEVKKLRTEKSITHSAIGRYLKQMHIATIELITGTKVAYKAESYFGTLEVQLDMESENFKHIKHLHLKVVD